MSYQAQTTRSRTDLLPKSVRNCSSSTDNAWSGSVGFVCESSLKYSTISDFSNALACLASRSDPVRTPDRSDSAYFGEAVDIGTVIAYKHGDRPMAAIRTKEKNHGIEESDQETQEEQEDSTDQAADKAHKATFITYQEVRFIGRKRRIRQAQTELSEKSLQLGVFGFGGDEDGNIGIGVFPQREKILIRGAGLGASGFGSGTLRGLRFEGVGARESQAG
jgi:hypothetical protein